MADNVTDYDAAVVGRLRQAGAIILGKNSMHEWAMGSTCSGMAFGTVRNPWDPDSIPGGSSGGSAAAVSASLAMAAVGTDGMGSIRVPAAYCGVVGLKGTYGLVSRFGELPPTSSWIDHVGPICKTVADTKAMLDVLAGHDPRDSTSRQRPRSSAWRRTVSRLRGLKVGIFDNYFRDDLEPEMASSFDAWTAALEGAGAELRIVSAPSLGLCPLALLAIQSERESLLLEYAFDPANFAANDIRLRIIASQFISASDHLRALRVRDLVRDEIRLILDEVDVVATPTTSTTALKIDAPTIALGPENTLYDRADPGVIHRATVRLTWPFNVAGVPAISVPAGFLSDGMPWGVQLAAGAWQDDVLLEIASAVEHELGVGYHVPPLAEASSVRDDA
jgi:aspartyl-tRNA(Asn)/glutamyl-tRNA(Gln) amidotransferase subunit A